MSCDSDSTSSDTTTTNFGFKNFKVHSTQHIYYLKRADPTSNEAKIMEKGITAESHDEQSYFYADSKSCEVRSNDPDDLYRALDITFQKNPSIFSKLYTTFGTILRYTSGGRADGKAHVNNDERQMSGCGSKPKM